jgi:hypothetical protein
MGATQEEWHLSPAIPIYSMITVFLFPPFFKVHEKIFSTLKQANITLLLYHSIRLIPVVVRSKQLGRDWAV